MSSVDGPNGLRFNTSLATDVAGSPAQSQTERLQQTINPSKAVFTIEPNTSKVKSTKFFMIICSFKLVVLID